MSAQHADLPVIAVDLGAGVRAGFTQRAGGVSTGAYCSLNLGLHVDDDREHVLENRRTAARWLGVPVTMANQVHGADVVEVEAPGSDDAGDLGDHDALVCAQVGAGIGVMVADCVPVLLADPAAAVVGAAHAGRPGLVAGVVQATVHAMTERGARVERLAAAIGPSICGECYEVPAPMRDEVDAIVPGTAAMTSWGTPSVDLPAGVASTLAELGVRHVERIQACTRTDDRFFSYRRDGRTGRFAGIIALTG